MRNSISLPLSVIHRTEPEITNKLHHFFYSVMVHFLILINLLLVYCGFALAQTCIVSSNSWTVIHGERSSVYVEVTAKSANGLVSAYGMDFSGHDWDNVWEIRSKAEVDCERFTEGTEGHLKQARRVTHFLASLNPFAFIRRRSDFVVSVANIGGHRSSECCFAGAVDVASWPTKVSLGVESGGQ